MGYVKHSRKDVGRSTVNHSGIIIPACTACTGLLIALFVYMNKDSKKCTDPGEKTVASQTAKLAMPKKKYKRMLGVDLGSAYRYSQTEYEVYKLNSTYNAWAVEKDLQCKTAFDWLKPNFFGADMKLVLHGEKLEKKFGALVIVPCAAGTEQDKAMEICSLFEEKYGCSPSREVVLLKHPEEFSPTAADRHEKFCYSLMGNEFYAEIVAVTASVGLDGPQTIQFRNDGFVVVLVVHPDFDMYLDEDKKLMAEDEKNKSLKAGMDNYNQL